METNKISVQSLWDGTERQFLYLCECEWSEKRKTFSRFQQAKPINFTSNEN